jgi:hypothetical protein
VIPSAVRLHLVIGILGLVSVGVLAGGGAFARAAVSTTIDIHDLRTRGVVTSGTVVRAR